MPLSIWLHHIDFDQASISTFIAAIFIALNLAARFAGLSRGLACWIYQASLVGLILYNASYMGGVMSPAMAWFGIVPFLPFFIF